MEERVHDWDIDYKNNLLHYYSRVVEQRESVKILIDYEEMKCSACSNWGIWGFDQHFVELLNKAKEVIQDALRLKEMCLIMELFMTDK